MTDQLDDRLRAWAQDVDDAIADARIDHASYVELGQDRRRSRTGMVAMAAAACLVVGSLAVVAAMVSNDRDGSAPVATDDGSERPSPGPTEPTGPPESLDPVITDASPAVGSSVVTTEDGDRIGLVLTDEGTDMDVCVRYEHAGHPGSGVSCASRSRPHLIVGGKAGPDSDEIVIHGAVGANGTTIRGHYASGGTVSVETVGLPEMGDARVFVVKVPLDTPIDSIDVLSRTGTVLGSFETATYFRLLQPENSSKPIQP